MITLSNVIEDFYFSPSTNIPVYAYVNDDIDAVSAIISVLT